MINQSWVIEECRLWNALHNPARGKRRPTLHGLAKGSDQYKKVKERLDDLREKDHAAGWAFYNDWVNH